VLSLLISVWACANDENIEVSGDMRMVARDSIKIEVLNEIKAFDYDAENKVFLLGDVADAMSIMLPPGVKAPGNELGFLLIDSKGQRLGQFNNTGEGPVNHGIGAMNNLLLDNGRIGVFTRRGFFVYDYDGNLIARSKALNSRSLTDLPTYRISAFQDGHLALGYSKITDRASQHWDSLYRYASAFSVFDLEELLAADNEVDEYIIRQYDFPEGVVDETISEFIPRITLDRQNGVLNVLFAKFHQVHQYAIADGSLLNVIDLKPQYFDSGNEPPAKSGERGGNWSGNGGGLINSAYHDMIQTGEYTLIRYSSAISMTQAEQLVSSGGPSASEYWETLRRTNYKYYYLLIKGGTIVRQDFQLEELEPQPGEEFFHSTTNLRGQLIGGDGLESLYVLYNNDYSEERSFKLIVRYALKAD
jgi:hypothetical protein